MTEFDVESTGASSGVTDGGTTPDPTGGGVRRRWLIVGLLILLAVVGGVGFFLASGDDGSDDEADESTEDRGLPTPPSTVGGEIDEEGQELLDLLAAGHELTYHATYEVEGDPEDIGDGLRIDVWRRDGRVRQDSRQETDASTVESASFLLADDEAIVCQRIDEGEWTCARQETGDELTAAGIFGNIARELEGVDVVATDERIGDEPARCFALPAEAGDVSQCMSEDGIPLRRTGNGAELVLVELSEDVPEEVFTPPAEPVSGDS